MTRFMKELSGNLGEYWRQHAEKELKSVEKELEEGKITIDVHGVARNEIGRILMDDMLEKVALVNRCVSVKNTRIQREVEVAEELEEYKKNKKPYTSEEIAEMKAAFGENATVVNMLTGEIIQL